MDEGWCTNAQSPGSPQDVRRASELDVLKNSRGQLRVSVPLIIPIETTARFFLAKLNLQDSADVLLIQS